MPAKKVGFDKCGPIKIDNPQKSMLSTPKKGVHGLVFGNGTATCLVGGVGASKTTTCLDIIAQMANWMPYYEHIL